MSALARFAGLAGIGAGIALAGEFSLFMLSGFSPDTFTEGEGAVAFLRERGGYLRAAVLVGSLGAALTTVFVVGLASRLRDAAPTRAAATAYFGVMGGVGHGLVALTFWVGIPLLIGQASRDPGQTAAAVGGLSVVTSGAEAFGNLFLALSMAAAGWAMASTKVLSAVAGWVGLAAAAFTLARIVGVDTPAAFVAFFPSLVGAVIFRLWGGISLVSSASTDVDPTADSAAEAETARSLRSAL
jgi:hypothetical protein